MKALAIIVILLLSADSHANEKCENAFFNSGGLVSLGHILGHEVGTKLFAMGNLWMNKKNGDVEAQVTLYGAIKTAWFPLAKYGVMNGNSFGDQLLMNTEFIWLQIDHHEYLFELGEM